MAKSLPRDWKDSHKGRALRLSRSRASAGAPGGKETKKQVIFSILEFCSHPWSCDGLHF